jgi:hypothetical protein
MVINRVKVELRRLHSPDVRSLEEFVPTGPFGILIQAMVGPLGAPGEESFEIMVCTPDWFAEQMQDRIVSGRHYLFVSAYSYEEICNYLLTFCASCDGDSWQEAAQKLGRLGKWEFEDYRP